MNKHWISAFVLAVSLSSAFSVAYRAGFTIPQPDTGGMQLTASAAAPLDGQAGSPRRPVRRAFANDGDE